MLFLLLLQGRQVIPEFDNRENYVRGGTKASVALAGPMEKLVVPY